MPRVKRSLTAQKKRRKVLKAAKGFLLSRSKLLRTATEAVNHAMNYAYRDRQSQKTGVPAAVDRKDQCGCKDE